MYIKESELKTFGLPVVAKQKNILSLVQSASTLIDEHCGRVEITGKGSLVYSTYKERIYLPEGRPMIRVSYKPIIGIPESTRAALSTSGDGDPNFVYTGFIANTQYFRGNLSPIISCSGRFGMARRGSMLSYPQMFPGPVDLYTISGVFGGPPNWSSVPVEGIEFDERTGELYIPIGLYPINEVEVVYNSGFDPRNMPRAIKNACAAVVLNFLGKGGTGVKSISGAGGVNVVMDPSLIDSNIEIFLRNYLVTLAT